MTFFLSRYINKIDKKGRVSIPSDYRAVLGPEEFNGVIIYPSFKNKCLEVCGLSYLRKVSETICDLDPYSEERDAFETVVLGEAVKLPFDGEGRVILPLKLIEAAGMSDQACFVGKGEVFEIWETQNFEEYLKNARKIAEQNRSMLKNGARREGP